MKPAFFYGTGAALAVFIGLFILHFGMHQIAGADDCVHVNLGLCELNGQKPYVDIVWSAPVFYTVGCKFALQWFGFYWRSFVIIMALFSALAFAWSLFLLTRLFGWNWTTLLWSLTMQIISPMLVSHWSYNSISDLTAVIYVLSAAYWLHRPDNKAALASYGFSLALLATMKPNVAGVLILGISAVLFVSFKHRPRLAAVSFGAFVLFLVFLLVNNVSFASMMASYLSVGRRGLSLIPFLHDLSPVEKRTAMLMLAGVLLPAVLVFSRDGIGRRSLVPWLPAIALLAGLIIFIGYPERASTDYLADDPKKLVGVATLFITTGTALFLGRAHLCSLKTWVPVIALLGALYGFITNSEPKLVDMPPVLASAILLVASLRLTATSPTDPVFSMPDCWNRYFAVACIVLGITGLSQGIARDRVKCCGPFFEHDGSRHILTDGFFKGVQCGDVFDELLKEEAQVLRLESSSTIWFGPRMQWGYAAFNKPPPLREPLFWDNVMFDKSKEELYFAGFLKSRWQVLILFKNDLTYYTQEERFRILQQYDVDQSFPVLTILRLKKA